MNTKLYKIHENDKNSEPKQHTLITINLLQILESTSIPVFNKNIKSCLTTCQLLKYYSVTSY